MRKTGVFFVPTRFMRIFTDINLSKERRAYQLHDVLQALNLEKSPQKGISAKRTADYL
jgi:hypothetical protein